MSEDIGKTRSIKSEHYEKVGIGGTETARGQKNKNKYEIETILYLC